MAISKKAREQIKQLIDEVVQSYLAKAKSDPKKNSGNPFTTSLLKDFEPITHRVHGLRTSLGGQLEKIAEIIAIDVWGTSNVKRKTNRNVRLPANVFKIINDIVSNLNNNQSSSDYDEELKKIIDASKKPSSTYEEQTYEFDLEIGDPENSHYYLLEMKGPDPNTTEVPGAKRRLLIEFAWGLFNCNEKNIDTYLAIYYNNVFPKEYANPKVMYYFESKGLLVHDAFWNFIGKDDNTFNQLVEIFEQYGKEKNEEIWKAFSALIGAERKDSK